MVADRQAKAKGIEQRTKTVHFATPQDLPKHRMTTSSQPSRSVQRHPGQQAALSTKKLEARGLEKPWEKMPAKERAVDTASSTKTTRTEQSREMSSTTQRADDIAPRTKASAIRGLDDLQEKAAANEKAKESETSLAAPSTSTAASTPAVKRFDNLSGTGRQQSVPQSSRRPFASDEGDATGNEEKSTRAGMGVQGAAKSTPSTDQRAPATEQGALRGGEARPAQVRDSPTLRRLRVVARERGSKASGEVLEMDVEADPRHVPKVRISSPTSWLKAPASKPGSLDGRPRQGASAGNPLNRVAAIPDPLFGGRNTNSKRSGSPMRPARQETKANVEVPRSEAKEAPTPATPSHRQDQTTRFESSKSLEATRASTSGTRQQLPTQASENLAQQEPDPGTAAAPLFGGQDSNPRGVGSPPKQLREKAIKTTPETPQRGLPASDASPWRSEHRLNHESHQSLGTTRATANEAVPRSPSVSAVIRQSQFETPPSKLRDGVTQPGQLGYSLPPRASHGSRIHETGSNTHEESSLTQKEAHGPGTSAREEEAPTDNATVHEATHSDLCIRGLTIVLHMKDREDLVISTDLTRGTGTSQ